MILPAASTYTQPVYIYQDSTSYTQRCLERSENADLAQKVLKGERLNDKDAQRVTTCVAEVKESGTKLVAGFFIVVFIAGIVLILIAACAQE